MSGYTAQTDAGLRILQRCDQLATISAPSSGVTRLYLTAEHRKAAELLQNWMIEAGMSARIDEVGNVIGKYASQSGNGPYLMLGSHFDSVIDAGKYDGPLGVITAIDCVARLKEVNKRLPIGLEVVAFGDEEGTRFATALAGSSAITGSFGDAHFNAKDSHGISVEEALKHFGLDPSKVPHAAHSSTDVIGYVEVHIEQGPVLEAESKPVGVVTGIFGQTRAKVTFKGAPNHAGTVPMRLRHDPLLAACEFCLVVERVAKSHSDTVATVGQFLALPGAMNIIPGAVELSIDVRSALDGVRTSCFDEIVASGQSIARKRGVEFDAKKLIDLNACPCSPVLVEKISSAIQSLGERPLLMPSGAGHDGMAMSKLTDIGMIFVRCDRGISHSPEESVKIEDVSVAAEVMYKLICDYAPGEKSVP